MNGYDMRLNQDDVKLKHPAGLKTCFKQIKTPDTWPGLVLCVWPASFMQRWPVGFKINHRRRQDMHSSFGTDR